MPRLLLALASICCMNHAVFAADRWAVQFFHDEDKSSLTINDLQFVSPNRGAAAGFLDTKKKLIPTVLVTINGGKNWSFVTTKEVGLSLFFLNDQFGWMVTESGIWATEEAGRSWHRIYKRHQLQRVYFVTPEHGWALGGAKTFMETNDGGKTWDVVKAAANVALNPNHTGFTWMDMTNAKSGIAVAKSKPPLRIRHEIPVWMESETRRTREVPTASAFLETKDGGVTWSTSVASTFGQVTRFRLNQSGRGLALLQFENFFNFPSEVLRLDLGTGKNVTAFRRKDRAITDVALIEDGPGYVAGFQPAGMIYYSPVPGPVKVLRSTDLKTWAEMPVDYRAVARRVILSAVDATHIWMATDNGMILRLVLD